MIRQLRLLIVLVRPAVLVLLGMYAAVGLTQAGRGQDGRLVAETFVVVIALLLFSVACNDIADAAIDRVNLAGTGRPLVAGTSRRSELLVVATTSALLTLGAAALLGLAALVVAACGMALSANYSLRPVRLAARGALASLLLPACYVGVPYLVGVFGARGSVRPADLALLAALYVGFIGRILLKDFRDVRGDALFGKRTFLVRHGRRVTCVFSASCWIAGTILLVAVERGVVFALAQGVCLAAALIMIRALRAEHGARRDEWLISGIAIVGRGMLLVLLAQLSMVRWQAPAAVTIEATLVLITLAQAVSMVRHGPVEGRRSRRDASSCQVVQDHDAGLERGRVGQSEPCGRAVTEQQVLRAATADEERVHPEPQFVEHALRHKGV